VPRFLGKVYPKGGESHQGTTALAGPGGKGLKPCPTTDEKVGEGNGRHPKADAEQPRSPNGHPALGSGGKKMKPEVKQQEKERRMVTFLMETIDYGGKLEIYGRFQRAKERFSRQEGIEGDGVIPIAQTKHQSRPLIPPYGLEGQTVQPQQ